MRGFGVGGAEVFAVGDVWVSVVGLGEEGEVEGEGPAGGGVSVEGARAAVDDFDRSEEFDFVRVVGGGLAV